MSQGTMNSGVRTNLKEKVENSSNWPNKETIEAMQEGDRIAKDTTVKGYCDLDTLLADLKS